MARSVVSAALDEGLRDKLTDFWPLNQMLH
jgi:hypothetical protein